MKLKLVFLTGKSSQDESFSRTLQFEHHAFNDIILEDFVDSFYNLTLKSVFALKYAHSSCPKSKFFIKTDDDVFLHIPNLIKLLQRNSLPSKLIMGKMMVAKYAYQEEFPKEFSEYFFDHSSLYPNFINGGTYIISINAIEDILRVVPRVPFVHYEDVYITGLLPDAAKIYPIGINNFLVPVRFYESLDYCFFKSHVVAMNLREREMANIWMDLWNERLAQKCSKYE